MTAATAVGRPGAGAHAGLPAGTGVLVRLILRRDRWLLAVWVIVLGALPVGFGAAGADAAYPSAADRLEFAAGAANPAELATRGPVFAATTGGLTAWTLASSGVLIGGVVSMLLVLRQTRVEEQSGRRELLGSTAIGRHTPLTAALLVVVAANLGVGVVAAFGLIAYGLPVVGSVAFGLVLAMGGILFAALGAVAAQLVDGAGAARGIGLAVLGALFVLAAVGEVAGSGLVWASPFGWARRVRAFAGESWWVLLLFVAVAVVLTAVAFGLSARRDVGAGLIPARPGPAHAPPMLRSPLAMAWRLHRGAIAAWTTGFVLIGALLGLAMASVGTQLDTPAFRQIAAELGGGSPADAFFRGILYVLAQVVAASVVAAALRIRGQEREGLADLLLAGPVSRARWALGHGVVCVAGATAALTGLGLGAGLGYGTPLPILGSTLAFLPACLFFAGLAGVLVGWAPRAAAPVTWALLILTVVLDFLAEFGLADADVLGLSPFLRTQAALVTGTGLAATTIAILVLAAALAATGIAGLRRRPITTG